MRQAHAYGDGHETRAGNPADPARQPGPCTASTARKGQQITCLSGVVWVTQANDTARHHPEQGPVVHHRPQGLDRGLRPQGGGHRRSVRPGTSRPPSSTRRTCRALPRRRRQEGAMLYQIHRYPADLIDVVRLADGQRVVIRPVLPQDEGLTAAFFGNLPAPARYDRFMSPMRASAAGPAQALHQRRLRRSPGAGRRGVRGRSRDRHRRSALRPQRRIHRWPSSPCRWPTSGRARASPAGC